MAPRPATHLRDLRNPVHLLAFGLGAGLAPVAPGTFGTLAAIPLYWLIQDLSLAWYAATLAGLLIVGVWLCGRTERDLGVTDHPGIVWDEVVGFLVTMTLAPPGWTWVVLGFIWFRLFDIWKPFPIRWLNDTVAGGWGVMLDDVLAGIYAGASLEVCVWLWTRNW